MERWRSYLSATLVLGFMFATGCKLKQEPAAVETEEQSSNPKIGATSVASITPISIYGAWHASNDYCTWGAVRTVTEFDSKNHWLIDRGDGQPSVNLVVLSFVQPLKLLNKTTDSQTLNGIPRGMTQDIVNYFKNSNIRVTLSIESAHLYDAPERL